MSDEPKIGRISFQDDDEIGVRVGADGSCDFDTAEQIRRIYRKDGFREFRSACERVVAEVEERMRAEALDRVISEAITEEDIARSINEAIDDEINEWKSRAESAERELAELKLHHRVIADALNRYADTLREDLAKKKRLLAEAEEALGLVVRHPHVGFLMRANIGDPRDGQRFKDHPAVRRVLGSEEKPLGGNGRDSVIDRGEFEG